MGRLRKTGPRRGTKQQYELVGKIADDMIGRFDGTPYEFSAERPEQIMSRTKNWITRHLCPSLLNQKNYQILLPYLHYMRQFHMRSNYKQRRKITMRISAKHEKVGSTQGYCRIKELKRGMNETIKGIIDALNLHPKEVEELGSYGGYDKKTIGGKGQNPKHGTLDFGPFSISVNEHTNDPVVHTDAGDLMSVATYKKRIEEIDFEEGDIRRKLSKIEKERYALKRLIKSIEELYDIQRTI